MPRDLPIGNGSVLVAFDSDYRLADFYYPHVGMENHAAARFRSGVWADDRLGWLEDAEWQKSLHYLRDTLVTDVSCENEGAALKLRCHDAVDPDANVYLRKVVVRNTRSEARSIKLFFHHDLNLYGNAIGDTAMYDPETRSIIHYKARRYFLINAAVEGEAGIEEYACGRSGIGGAEGTWRDAEDGVLSMSPIAQGAVESTIGIPLRLEPMGTATLFYWICAGRDYGEVRRLDANIRNEGPSRALSRAGSYWYTWLHKPAEDIFELPDEIIDLYRRSLLVIRTQCDSGGAVLAANDSDIQWGHNDHYSYMWARDAAFVCDAMDRAGFPELTRRFLQFAHRVIRDDGFLLHKYNPDGSYAPLWHPWVRAGRTQLPIQEDETALVVWLVSRHYQRTRDLELLRLIYDRLVVRPAEFLVRYRDPETRLPLPSFDMWEERQGVFTFTCSAVYAGLQAAAELANLFNEQERRMSFATAAAEVRDAMVRHLWIEEEGRFARGLVLNDGEELVLDKAVDSSCYAVFHLGVFPPASAFVGGTMEAIRERLWVQTEVGGIARYEDDAYHRISDEAVRVPGNPWLICTLWLAEHAVARATSIVELQSALDLVRWARAKASPSLILPEQIDPYDGQALSVAPLTWSHAQVVSVVRAYIDAQRNLRAASGEHGARNQVRLEGQNPVDNQ
ncbi:MAG TPA: glycoside hydrolase family 15 protein [Thermoanaerobaculia bacterium]|nr:glycoside hydrolase family 15 protein [Thermoanaerobaculia bacterium]